MLVFGMSARMCMFVCLNVLGSFDLLLCIKQHTHDLEAPKRSDSSGLLSGLYDASASLIYHHNIGIIFFSLHNKHGNGSDEYAFYTLGENKYLRRYSKYKVPSLRPLY